MFVPNLALRQDGSDWTLMAEIQVPNSCYFNKWFQKGWPDEMTGIPETQAVRLLVGHTGSMVCLPGIQTFEYSVPIEGSDGHSNIVALTVQDGEVLGRSSIQIPNADDASLRPESLADKDKSVLAGSGTDSRYSLLGATAWVDRIPPGPASLHVIARVFANSGGWTFSLEPAEQQKSNKAHLILDLVAREPRGGVTWIMTTYEARYRMDSYEGSYTHVVIRDGDSSVTTRISETS